MRYETDEREMPGGLEGAAAPVEIGRSDEQFYVEAVIIAKGELEGLDLYGFKALLREKFHLLGDALVTAFLKERAGG